MRESFSLGAFAGWQLTEDFIHSVNSSLRTYKIWYGGYPGETLFAVRDCIFCVYLLKIHSLQLNILTYVFFVPQHFLFLLLSTAFKANVLVMSENTGQRVIDNNSK